MDDTTRRSLQWRAWRLGLLDFVCGVLVVFIVCTLIRIPALMRGLKKYREALRKRKEREAKQAAGEDGDDDDGDDDDGDDDDKNDDGGKRGRRAPTTRGDPEEFDSWQQAVFSSLTTDRSRGVKWGQDKSEQTACKATVEKFDVPVGACLGLISLLYVARWRAVAERNARNGSRSRSVSRARTRSPRPRVMIDLADSGDEEDDPVLTPRTPFTPGAGTCRLRNMHFNAQIHCRLSCGCADESRVQARIAATSGLRRSARLRSKRR